MIEFSSCFSWSFCASHFAHCCFIALFFMFLFSSSHEMICALDLCLFGFLDTEELKKRLEEATGWSPNFSCCVSGALTFHVPKFVPQDIPVLKMFFLATHRKGIMAERGL